MFLLFSPSVTSDKETLWTVACQTSGSFTISRTLLRFMSIESVMISNHLILCCPLFLLCSIFSHIRVFSNESTFHIREPKYWNFSLDIFFPISIWLWFPLVLTGLISWQSKRLSRVFSSTTVQKYWFFGTEPSLLSHLHIHTWLLENKHSFDYKDFCWQRVVSTF